MRELCPPGARASHGSAASGLSSSSLSASVVGLRVDHENPLDNGHDDANFDVKAPFPCAVQIGVFPQSRPTPGLQRPVVSDTLDCAVRGLTAVSAAFSR